MLENGTSRSASNSLTLSRIVYRQQNVPIQPASAIQKTCITNIKMNTPQDSAAETKLPGALLDMRSKKLTATLSMTRPSRLSAKSNSKYVGERSQTTQEEQRPTKPECK